MHILITGGAGYVGSILLEDLLHSDLEFEKITIYDNLMYKQLSLLNKCHDERFNFVYGDVRDEEKLKECINNADIIIPLAAIVGFPACESYKKLAYDVNFEQIQTILKYKSKEQYLLFPSTISCYGINESDICYEDTELKPLSHYSITKRDAENLLLDEGNSIIFRLATVFGSSARMRLDLLINDFTYKAFTDGYIVLFEKEFKRNFIHLKDVSRGFIHMIKNYKKNKGQIFNLGSSKINISKYELALEIKNYITDFVIKIDEYKKDIDKRNYIISSNKIENTNFETKYSLQFGIKELIKAYGIISKHHTNFTNL